mmetsp:Transcript_10074/g.22218  ORF Transcript_10074/g.22218 Transcript_10074/m.22218 type:complete len:253 (+) Transcript_10074:135-893(+)
MRAFLLVLALAHAATGGAEMRANPAVQKYYKWTQQLLQDAKEARAAAAMYEKMTREAVPEVTKDVAKRAYTNMLRSGVKKWARAAWDFEKKLVDPRPEKAAEAAAKAFGPWQKDIDSYTKAQSEYDGAAQLYALRVEADQASANKIMTQAHQAAMEGDSETWKELSGQATILAKQAEGFAATAKEYHGMAHKLRNAAIALQGDGGKAAALAAWGANPMNELPPEYLYPFTVAPPIALVETGATHSLLTKGKK